MKWTSDDTFGVILLALLAGVLVLLAFFPIPKDNQQLFTALAAGVLGAGVGTFLGYRWGSSKGSHAKDATIASLTAAPPTPSAPEPGAPGSH